MNRIDDGHTLSLLACAFTRATGRSRSRLFFCFRIFWCWVVNTGIITVTNKYMAILGISLIIMHCLGWCHKMTPGTWHYIVGKCGGLCVSSVSSMCQRNFQIQEDESQLEGGTQQHIAIQGFLEWCIGLKQQKLLSFFPLGTSRVSVFSRNDDEPFQPLFQTEAPFFESVV